jgi:Uma2 family endonuclease
MAIALKRRLFTSTEYHTMLEAGILSEDDRTELIEGEILAMAAIGSRHMGCVNRLSGLLFRSLDERAIVSVQNPVLLDDHSEPQPDIAVLRFRADHYGESLPGPSDALLLVEVADASADYDRNVKLPLYARQGIPEVWLVDLASSCIEVHQAPQARHFTRVRRVRRGEAVSPGAFPDLLLQVDAILG